MEPEEEPGMAAVREVCEEVCTKKEHGVPCEREPDKHTDGRRKRAFKLPCGLKRRSGGDMVVFIRHRSTQEGFSQSHCVYLYQTAR